ncbi:MAG: aminotransferase class V-fold PLP-dependent enzyme [Gemmataceae bacterium]|nr:aminotransferase class V-fold PLP-dependent enzyme [Gemmataceae bacterium]
MLRVGRYVFKRADARHEFDGIHRLNYRTFVEEIAQHADPGTGVLVDKFHHKNLYFIAVRDDQVVGMISAHAEPPFSIATRLSDPSILERPGQRPIEVRLLAIEPAERNNIVLVGLMWCFYEYARDQGFTNLYISGVSERVELYQRMGFTALGPAVAGGSATFVPMTVAFPQMQAKLSKMIVLWKRHMLRMGPDENGVMESVNGLEPSEPNVVCLLPGPVTTAPAVRDAFHEPPIYHRGPDFVARFERVRRQLGEMVGGREVALCNGSGTLANEAIAATLGAEVHDEGGKRGIILVNGEFGQRLARQASRFGLNPRVLTWPWGSPWNLDEVDAALAEEPDGSWIWGVHLESSTGVLNDLAGLVRRARAHGVRVCVDCISSLGAVPIDLSGVYLASGATGKSLGSYAGISIVFANGRALPRLDLGRLPSYFDIAAHLGTEGPRYTFPSPILRALQAALAEYATPDLAQARYERYAALGMYVRRQLREFGLAPLADEDNACPVVTTFLPPSNESGPAFVDRCRSWGYAIGGQSGYLMERRMVQIATMGAIRREDLLPFFDHLGSWLTRNAILVG